VALIGVSVKRTVIRVNLISTRTRRSFCMKSVRKETRANAKCSWLQAGINKSNGHYSLPAL
jgi:hypothetical protein